LSFLKLNKIVGALAVGIMSGLALTAITLSNFVLHSQFIMLNVYTNGTADWTVDATMLLKSFFALLFVTFCVGLSLGVLATRRN
jgi:hypothetical protein